MKEKTKFIAHGWDTYMENVYPDGACEQCLLQTKQAFYAGALVMYTAMETIVQRFDGPECEAVVRSVTQEIIDQLKSNWSTTEEPDEG